MFFAPTANRMARDSAAKAMQNPPKKFGGDGKCVYLWRANATLKNYITKACEAMIYVKLPEGFAAEEQRLPFFLAMEEFLARKRDGEYFFMWQVAPTVIFGRNQRIEAEVNLEFCREKGIQTCRRKSGGGCVYADRNNIMFSHITTSDAVATTFSRFTGEVAAMLRKLGIGDAASSGRNDILIGDRKVSGYAFYHINLPSGSGNTPLSRAIVHGTMLYDADLATMAQAITPSSVKLEAKGVASVRKHVTTIREHSSVGLQEFKNFAISHLCDTTITLTSGDIASIREIEQGYYDHNWIYGRQGQHLATPRRIEGAGEFDISIGLIPGVPPRIDAIDMTGDFFIMEDLDDRLFRALHGVELSRNAIIKALHDIDVSHIIHNLSNDAFADLLIQAPDGTPTETIP